jgi:hypothetical protein
VRLGLRLILFPSFHSFISCWEKEKSTISGLHPQPANVEVISRSTLFTALSLQAEDAQKSYERNLQREMSLAGYAAPNPRHNNPVPTSNPYSKSKYKATDETRFDSNRDDSYRMYPDSDGYEEVFADSHAGEDTAYRVKSVKRRATEGQESRLDKAKYSVREFTKAMGEKNYERSYEIVKVGVASAWETTAGFLTGSPASAPANVQSFRKEERMRGEESEIEDGFEHGDMIAITASEARRMEKRLGKAKARAEESEHLRREPSGGRPLKRDERIPRLSPRHPSPEFVPHLCQHVQGLRRHSHGNAEAPFPKAPKEPAKPAKPSKPNKRAPMQTESPFEPDRGRRSSEKRDPEDPDEYDDVREFRGYPNAGLSIEEKYTPAQRRILQEKNAKKLARLEERSRERREQKMRKKKGKQDAEDDWERGM